MVSQNYKSKYDVGDLVGALYNLAHLNCSQPLGMLASYNIEQANATA
jgi:hypothetical protein